MNTNPAKIGAVAVTLVATWGTAQADIFKVEVKPTQAFDNVQIYTQRIPGQPFGSPADTKALTANLGSVAANGTLTAFVSTSYGTSTAATSNGDTADFSLVGTSGNLGVIVGGSQSGQTFNFNDSFPAISQTAASTAIKAGDLTNVSKLYNQGRVFGNDVYGRQEDAPRPQLGSLFYFNDAGVRSDIGTYSVTFQAVPEPTTFAALGLGAAAMLRRRRKA